MNETTLGYFALMILAGIGIPVMAGMNAGLGVKLESPVAAVFILTCVAALGSGAILLFKGASPNFAQAQSIPPTYYFAGFFFILYILSITLATPVIGLGNAVFLVLLGQLVAAALIDHYGLFGVPVAEITLKRVLGLVIMMVGIFLARKEIVG